MTRRLPTWTITALLLAVAARPGASAPIDSNLAASVNGGGCHPTGIAPALLDMLTLINPEWAPVVNGTTVDTEPVLLHGTVEHMHGDTSGDFPSTHLRADVVHQLRLDAADADRLGTGNDDGLLQTEWEAGVYPAWAWAGEGDRVVALGRYIFDCGHPGAVPGNCSTTATRQCVIDTDCRPPLCATCGELEACVGTQYRYSTELHPPHATAAIRQGRGAVLPSRKGAKPVLATRADVFVAAPAGGAGDRCVLTHQEADLSLLQVECFPLSQPTATLNARDFEFDLPLPPRPARARGVRWRVVEHDTPGGVPARLTIRPRLDGSDPHLTVTARMTKKRRGTLPTGVAATIFAGWRKNPAPLTHVRLTLDALVVNNALQPVVPTVPKTCGNGTAPCATTADCPAGQMCLGRGPVESWSMQAALNGEWQELTGLGSVDTGAVIPEGLVYDQYLPPDGTLLFVAEGRSQECIDAMYGKSLAQGIVELGILKGVICLGSEARNPGAVAVTHPGPDFGAGPTGSATYETTSVGGVGGHCSITATMQCTVDADCPAGEACPPTGGAFALRYRIERLS